MYIITMHMMSNGNVMANALTMVRLICSCYQHTFKRTNLWDTSLIYVLQLMLHIFYFFEKKKLCLALFDENLAELNKISYHQIEEKMSDEFIWNDLYMIYLYLFKFQFLHSKSFMIYVFMMEDLHFHQ